jgi:membrane-associated phospholipid phosphatase
MTHALFRSINDFAKHTSVLHGPFRLFAEYGVVLFAVLLAVSWWLARRDRNLDAVACALWAPVGMLIAIGLNQPLGRAVHEARPYDAMPHVLVLVHRTTDFSFPSDHAVMAGAVAMGVLLTHRRLGVFAWALALLMAFARVYVGAHYPIDVLAGLVFGATVTALGYLVLRRPGTALVKGLAKTPAGVLVSAGGNTTS